MNTINIAKDRNVARLRKFKEKKEVSTKATAEVGARKEDVDNSAIEPEQEKRKIPYKKRFKTTRWKDVEGGAILIAFFTYNHLVAPSFRAPTKLHLTTTAAWRERDWTAIDRVRKKILERRTRLYNNTNRTLELQNEKIPEHTRTIRNSHQGS